MQDALITLTGNVGTEVEFSQGEGWQLARFRLACTPRRLRQGTWVDQETTWIGVNAWGRTAQHVQASLAKGDPVVVTGRLRTAAWSDAQGVRHERLVVEASALGHDLSRGCSTFTRTPREPVADGAPTAPGTSTGALLAGQRDDARTGGQDGAPTGEPGAPATALPDEPAREEVLAHC